MATTSLDTVKKFTEFRMLFGANQGICDLDEQGLDVRTGTRNASRFDLATTLIVTGTAASPRAEMLTRTCPHRFLQCIEIAVMGLAEKPGTVWSRSSTRE